jgi:hypothetical protein
MVPGLPGHPMPGDPRQPAADWKRSMSAKAARYLYWRRRIVHQRAYLGN